MKRLLILVFALFFWPAFLLAQDIYSIPLRTIEASPVDLGIYKGKKMVFLILPLMASDSSLKRLASVQERFSDQVRLIGIPSIEDGFKTGHEPLLKKLYEDRGLDIVILKGMRTKKAAGISQSPLMKWLTNKSLNMHFDVDAMGVGQMFFVDEKGNLYAVIGPEFSFSSSLMDQIVNRPLVQ